MSSQKLLDEISNLIGASALSANEQEIVLTQLKNYKRLDDFKTRGERPPKVTSSPEHKTWYRKKCSEYIKSNTGIWVPENSSVSPQFYDLIINYLKL